jgi:hypothetical protein
MPPSRSSTHNQALSALLFLYREVLGIDLPWVNYSELKHRASNDCLVVTFFFDKQPVALTAFAASVLRGLAFALG